jgi:hypothetical protein
MAGINDLVREIREASRGIEQGESRTSKRLDGIESSVNELYRKVGRPLVEDGKKSAAANGAEADPTEAPTTEH